MFATPFKSRRAESKDPVEVYEVKSALYGSMSSQTMSFINNFH